MEANNAVLHAASQAVIPEQVSVLSTFNAVPFIGSILVLLYVLYIFMHNHSSSK